MAGLPVTTGDPEIIWQPTEKQSEFLSASEFEVLYGGAAGGGKTDGLLIDALGLQHGGIEKRAYQGIIFRKTFPDLKDIIDRAHEIYGAFDPRAKYDKAAHVWTFPSGARIEFGFIQRDIERFRYRGRAFAYVGWEEITLWPTEVPYRYLLSRIRCADPTIPLYCRATTNPDGPGFEWVKAYWQIPNNGEPTRFEIDLTDPESGRILKRARRFIPARLSDNPHLDKDDNYRANLLLLDQDEQGALLLGKWETPKIKGAYYTKEFEKARKEGRIGLVPHKQGVPVNSFWDFGVNDTTAIWLHQNIALQNRFFACMEASGEPLSFFVKWLLEQGVVYGTHYLPHDGDHERLGLDDTKSYKEMLQELLPGHRFIIVPRIPDVLIGIQQTRDAFDSCWFDKTGCAEGIAALQNYRKEWDEQLQVYRSRPLHDWASNYADAFRQFGQGWAPNNGKEYKRRKGGNYRTA